MLRAVVLVCLVALAAAAKSGKDQPAVTIFKPNQGTKWSVGQTIPTGISWGKTSQIKYTDIEISLIDSSKDPFDYPANAIQLICGKLASSACPAIMDGVIDFSWVLDPKNINYLGQATILVRAKWDDVTSPGVIDTLSQTLTILIVQPTPTPSKKPTRKPDTPTPTKKAAPTPTPSKKPAPTPTPSKKPAPTPNVTTCQPGCSNGSMCCNQECVAGSYKSHFCCETNNYPYACMLGKANCCGFECCPLGQDCCGHGLTQVCCPSGAHCCGGTCMVGACPTKGM